MNVWIVTREYAGLAEAGGVKNVSRSLAEALTEKGCKVTVFIPFYGCTCTDFLENKLDKISKDVIFSIQKSEIFVSYHTGNRNGVSFVLVDAPCFKEKQSVYTYTDEDEKKSPLHKAGEGFEDWLLMDTVFQKAAVFASKFLTEKPDIIHCQDAACALTPVFIENIKYFPECSRSFYKKAEHIVTIHNAGPGYLHDFSSLEEAESYTALPAKILKKGLVEKRIDPFLLASVYSSLTTVSPWYAQEILNGQTDTQGLGQELKKRSVTIKGICNGIDFSLYDTSDTQKSLLPFAYKPSDGDLEGKSRCRDYFLQKHASKDSLEFNRECSLMQFGFIEADSQNKVFIAYHGRIVHQKGIDVLEKAARICLKKSTDVCFILAGQGFPALEELLEKLAEDFKGRVVYLKGYDRAVSRLCIAAADFSLHPSCFEPCGLEDFIAQILGTIPVANATGGLRKIIDKKTGFLYSPNTPEKLSETLLSLSDTQTASGKRVFYPMISNAAESVKNDFSWKNIIQKEYFPFYNSLIK